MGLDFYAEDQIMPDIELPTPDVYQHETVAGIAGAMDEKTDG